MKYGARNQLIGKVTKVVKDGIMCQVDFDISDNAKMSSVMTKESLEAIGVKKGDKVRVIVKAVNVLIVKE
ncbi:MAG: TOBE domain-containing protein [bacterium]|nr:TOBE domain-containing protein [bacterium]